MMNTYVVEEVPDLQFQEVSIYHEKWQERFHNLVRDVRPITFDVYEMPVIPFEIAEALGQAQYRQLVLKSNEDRRFLVTG